MLVRRFCFVAIAALVLCCGGPRPVSADGIAPYDTFVKGATAQNGLFTLWHKDGKLYLELAPGQLNHDFVQTIVPSSGIGGQFVVAGNTDHLPSELLRFERADAQVAIVWDNPYFIAPNSAASGRAIARNFPRSIVGLANIAASDDKTGAIVIDASPFLEDQLNLKAILAQNIHDTPKADPYVLDHDKTYFGSTKSFPKNVVIEALQDWTSDTQHIADAIPDPRHLQMHVTYNIADITPSPDYRPRYADDRVGIYNDIYLSFDNDQVITRDLRYLVRWNLQPSDPTKPVSPALHPMIFTMSDTIPEAYRPAIKAAVLKWNDAFLKLGMSDAVQVVDQPNDPNFDPDDIRYNVLRWVTEQSASFGADSQTLFDPRTGEEFRTGILISSDVPLFAKQTWDYVVDPVRFGRSTDPMPQKFLDDVWLGTIMHETGHNLGMQHNFVGSRAYTAKELQDKNFTSKYGIASTVMEYAPTNIWPKPYANGDYSQVVLGPYDYYAMQYAYGPIPGAKTPEDELPTLEKLASQWSNPRFRYASDEDVSWGDGHAADPRAEQGILTNDMLDWCGVQMKMDHDLMTGRNQLFPQQGEAYEAETAAFRAVFGGYLNCATFPTHYIGGQYLSRAHRGDPGAEAPVVPVPKADQWRAFQALDTHLFSSAAWSLPPSVLSHLAYSEWAGYGYVGFEGYGNLPKWAYDPPQRHDYRYSEHITDAQAAALKEMFSAPVLARMAEGQLETSDPNPMRLADLFGWIRSGVLRELGAKTVSIDPLRRTLQQNYLDRLVALYSTPEEGAPADARALARADLVFVEHSAALASGRSSDATTRAHLDLLRARAHQALNPAP
jgi:Met-zincin/Domain of unknown function (DUF5117)/Domain of unknown function (DUF5118)